jgi:heterodisulfide reductase subunit B
MDDPENPTMLDEIAKAVGASPVEWSYKTECCGASMSVPFPSAVETITGRLAGMAREAGANCFVVACPLCQLNLDTRQTGPEPPLPTFFFTELLALALELPGVSGWLSKRYVSPEPVLRSLSAAAEA